MKPWCLKEKSAQKVEIFVHSFLTSFAGFNDSMFDLSVWFSSLENFETNHSKHKKVAVLFLLSQWTLK